MHKAIGLAMMMFCATVFAQQEEATVTKLTGTWECVTEEAAFSPRDTAEDFIIDGKMWISNGFYHGNVLHRDLYWTEDGATWTQVEGETPYDGYSEMAVYEDKVWAVKSSVWNSEDGINWSLVLDETPFGVRGYGELVVHNDQLFQLGSGRDVYSSSDGATWERVQADTGYESRSGSAVASYKGKLWVMGGGVPPRSTMSGHRRMASPGSASSSMLRGRRANGSSRQCTPTSCGFSAAMTTPTATTSRTPGTRRTE